MIVLALAQRIYVTMKMNASLFIKFSGSTGKLVIHMDMTSASTLMMGHQMHIRPGHEFKTNTNGNQQNKQNKPKRGN